MGKNEIYNNKIMTFGIDTTRTIGNSKADVLLEILDYPAVSVRSHRDDLIKFNGDKEEPRLMWNEEILTIMDEGQLRMLLTFIENRNDAGAKRH